MPLLQETDKEADHMETEQSQTREGPDPEDNGGGGRIGLVRGLYNNMTPLDRINFNVDSYDNAFAQLLDWFAKIDFHEEESLADSHRYH